MGKMYVRDIGSLCGKVDGLEKSVRELSVNELRARLEIISTYCSADESSVCYVFGMGAHPKETYRKIRKEKGVRVVWVGSIFSGLMGVLRFFISSYAGLVKIVDHKKIPDIFLALAECSMAGIYIFPRGFEEIFVSAVKDNPLPEDYSFGIEANKNFFVYMVDADSIESSTGMFEVVCHRGKYILPAV